MLISDSAECIFIHNYKVAGRSIRIALREAVQNYFENTTVRDRILRKVGLSPLKHEDHLKAKEVKRVYPKRWKKYFKFGFVRNPWSWQVSLYFYMLKNTNHEYHDITKELDGFDEYVKWRVENEKVLQKSFFCDERGNLIVDFIGKLESIENDFEYICDVLNLEANLPRSNSTNHKNYKCYYNSCTKKIIQKEFEDDIKKFNYSF